MWKVIFKDFKMTIQSVKAENIRLGVVNCMLFLFLLQTSDRFNFISDLYD